MRGRPRGGAAPEAFFTGKARLTGSMARARTFNTRYPISSSIQVADVDGDGAEEFVVASRRVWSVGPGGRRRPQNLLQGKRPFASTAALVDLEAGQGVVIGCDDGWVYASMGAYTTGWKRLVRTGLDVYSSPVAFGVGPDAEDRLLAFGSDDGGIWCVDIAGVSRPGFPVRCGAFVSATPAVCDFDGDGAPEILVGDWAGRFHALRLDGTELPGFPVDLGWPVWSSAAVADIDGDGNREAVVATRELHAFRANGKSVPGFPRRLGTYAVASPIVVDLKGDRQAAAVVGCDKLYAFDGAGRALAGFPADLGCYLWASPIAAETTASASLVLFVGGWDGNLHEVRVGQRPTIALATEGPIFGAAALAENPGGGATLAVGSWDGRVRFVHRGDLRTGARAWPTFHRSPTNERVNPSQFRRPEGTPSPQDARLGRVVPTIAGHSTRPSPTRHRRATFIDFEAEGLEAIAKAQLVYRVAGEDRTHPSPAVAAAGRLTALVQPLGVGRVVSFHLEGSTFEGVALRYPASGEVSFIVRQAWGLPLGGLVARLEGRQ